MTDVTQAEAAAATPATPTPASAKAAGQSFLAHLGAIGAKAEADVLKDIGLARAWEKSHAFVSGLILGGCAVLIGVRFFHLLIG